MKKRGFTLAELLVTIVILGIITGLSIPVIRGLQASQSEKRYSIYVDSVNSAAKLYTDSYSEDLFEALKNINPSMTILSITHHIEEALNADEIIILNDGQVSAVGTPKEILYDEELLSKNSLLAPFVVEVKKELNKYNIDIEECFTMEELVSKL